MLQSVKEIILMYKIISVPQRVRPGYSIIRFNWLAAFALIFVAILFNRNSASTAEALDLRNGLPAEGNNVPTINPKIIGSDPTGPHVQESDYTNKLLKLRDLSAKLSTKISKLPMWGITTQYKYWGLFNTSWSERGFCFGASKCFLKQILINF